MMFLVVDHVDRFMSRHSFPRRSSFLKIAPLFLLAIVIASNATCSDEESVLKESTFTFYQENDLYTGTDRDYTNGIKMTWISPDLSEYRDDPRLSFWGHSLIDALPFNDAPGFLRTISLSMGQNIYTPDQIYEEDHKDGDRPYAGVTYCALGFHSRDALIMDTWEFDIGIVGPHSYAEKMQKAVHRWTNSDYPNGWENQIKDEPFLNLYYERKWRIFPGSAGKGFGYDVIPHMGCAVGNAFTAMNGGGQVRFGWNLPNDFGTLLIRPGSDTNAPIDEQDPRYNRKIPRFGIHAFTALDGYACLLDITLDGNNFRSGDRVDRYPFFAHIAGGLGVVSGRFKATYAYVYRTKEYTTQKDRQKYGAVTISYTFRN
ncbi:MAG TPA: lipid A deacylase LpxR family protein [Methanoregulaceae archaeon]|nr:lipid A deacylase LpxR family protein [Bacteroidales bacterium]HQM56730.1 lipid A deacylase LpxR family protein [Methanoregulaceae archaeon]